MNKYQKARHPNTPEDALRTLSTDEDYNVRCGVARNPNAPEDALRTLVTDDCYWIRYWAAHNPNATELVRRLFLMTQAQKQNV
jgi:hypothetical protein